MISQFEGLYRTDVDRDGNHGVRMELMWSLLHRAFHCFPSGDTSVERSRVQIYRRTFGLTVLIGRWYQPIHDAFEALREANRTGSGSGRINGMATPRTLVHTIGYTSNPPIARAEVSSEVVISSPALSADLAARVISCLVSDETREGLFGLRKSVHLYMALNNTHLQSDAATENELGLGLSPATTDGSRPFFTLDADASRVLPFHWPDVLRYVQWWNTVAAMGLEERTNNLIGGLVGDDAYSIDHIFQSAKEMAKIVLLYCDGVADRNDLNAGNPRSFTALVRASMRG